ncbi:MAG: holA [Burkholderiales bacterium]|jgi:DNA polymerase-3 subunit delta|nr:holA [Burkholderiales bacterium]
MNNSLAKILNPETTLGSALFIHVSADDYPLADFALQQLKNRFDNYHKQYFTVDKSFNSAVIEDTINNVSLFDQPNYIQISFKTKPNAAWQKQLIELMAKLNNNNFLVIVCDKLNKTDQNTKWFTEIANIATTLGISNVDAEFLISYILNDHNLEITQDALHTLITQNQGNFSQLLNEADKLTLAIPEGHTIDVREITKLTTDNAQYNIYQLSAGYLSGNLAKSIKVLDNLYQDSSDAILIMWMLQEDVKRLLKIKSKLKTIPNINQVIKEMYIWGESAANLPLAHKRLDYNTLVDIYQDLAQLDMSIKGVMDLDVRLLLVKVIKKMCGA